MADLCAQSVIIHFKDGRIQTGILRSSLLSGKTIQYLPQLSINDRRMSRRMTFIKEVRVDQIGMRRATDLSSRGMYIECLTPCPVGTILPVSIDLGDETICLDARVAFNDPGIGMGLEFNRLSSVSRLKLETFVQQAMKSANGNVEKDRRLGENRSARMGNSNHTVGRAGWSKRLQNRRRGARSPCDPVEVELSRIKLVFFQNSLSISHAKGQEVVIEFRDSETIQVKAYDISPETIGFFVDLNVAEGLSYTIYVVKSAVKSIQYLL